MYNYISTVLVKYILLKSFSPPPSANKINCFGDGKFLFTNRLYWNFLADSTFLLRTELADTHRMKVFEWTWKNRPDAPCFIFFLKKRRKFPKFRL